MIMEVTVIESIVKVKNAPVTCGMNMETGSGPCLPGVAVMLSRALPLTKETVSHLSSFSKLVKPLALNSSIACSLLTIGKDLLKP
jgi:hypothetical protein